MYKNNENKILTKINPYIFSKKINTNLKLVPFNILTNDSGKIKYLSPVSKEWKNNIYNYNKSSNINFPIYDLYINKLIKGYFNLYFNYRYLEHKYISRKSKRKSLNKIFVSKAEIKHTSSKAIVTIYVYNRERRALESKIRKLQKIIILKKIFIKFLYLLINRDKSIGFITLNKPNLINQKNYLWMVTNFFKVDFTLTKIERWLFIRLYRYIKKLNKILNLIRRYRLRLSLNKSKFEEKFLLKLSQLVRKYYGKKVEFNIINLKSIAYNSDIFTEILTIKLRKKTASPMKIINALLGRVVLPKVNRIIETGRSEKNVDLELMDNRYKNINISSIINKTYISKDNLNKLLYNLYYKTNTELSSKYSNTLMPELKDNDNELNNDIHKPSYLKLRNIIFHNIKYKNMGGVRIRVKGRLTKRYRADRAIYKLIWKGGLKNIDSTYKGLSTVVLRGYLNSNVEKSILISKRRIGSFGVVNWFSGK